MTNTINYMFFEVSVTLDNYKTFQMAIKADHYPTEEEVIKFVNDWQEINCIESEVLDELTMDDILENFENNEVKFWPILK